MGAGSRSHHQHHHVDPGTVGAGGGIALVDEQDDELGQVTQFDVEAVAAEEAELARADAENYERLRAAAGDQGQFTADGVEHILPDSSAVRLLSYAPDSGPNQLGTLEVCWRSNGATYRFAEVPGPMWERLQQTHIAGGSVGHLVSTEVVGHFGNHLVGDNDTLVAHTRVPAALPGIGPGQQHCPTCGQFVGATAHHCPISSSITVQDQRPNAGSGPHLAIPGTVTMPELTTMRANADFAHGPLLVPVTAQYDNDHGDPHRVTGHAQLLRDTNDIEWDNAIAALDCTCGENPCSHRYDTVLALSNQFHGIRGQRRCPTCGQFVGAITTHDCPIPAVSTAYFSGPITLNCPSITAMQRHCDFGDVSIPVPITAAVDVTPELDGNSVHFVEGTVNVYGPQVPIDPVTAAAGLSCTCGRPACRHAQLAAADLIERVRSPLINSPDRRATTAVLDELAAEHVASSQAQDAARAVPVADATYSGNPDAFQADYRQALARVADGQPAVPYMTENATGGLGSRDGGRAFGVELEFDLSGPNHRSRLNAIARDLHAAGLSTTTSIGGYHASEHAGYTEARNGWRLEEDCTVAGEIVSPILWDTPETWNDLQTVCDIIQRHGGRATTRTGGHVHVGIGNFDHTVSNHNRLMQLVDAHSDTLFRLASNPERGTHRGTSWCRPNHVPSQGYRDIGHARSSNAGHGLAVNMQSVSGRRNDHVEFRMWDGSLEPSVVQSQIKVSLGLAQAAFREAGSTSAPNDGHVDHVGAHRRVFGRRRLNGEQWRQATRGFRSLMDTVFHRDEDRAQLTGLFAVTRWQR